MEDEMIINDSNFYDYTLSERHIELFRNHKGFCIKPNLRPMSSMTDKERDEFQRLDTKCDKMPTFDYVSIEHYRIFDWLNEHHFDYRGLIPKGLALSTEVFNPYKN